MICLEWSGDWRLALQTEALWLAFFNGYITKMKYSTYKRHALISL
jgi:hypothetical protein